MSLLLHIDTAQPMAMVCLSKADQILEVRYHTDQKSHAEFLQPAIQDILKKNGCIPADLQAVSVSNGPGSYTGLRVGLSAAKGLCFALGIPLIAISTLDIMALAARMQEPDAQWVCPMIDARRMEVFTAVYSASMQCMVKPSALVLDEHAYQPFLTQGKVLFSGSGAEKWKKICRSDNALFGAGGMEEKAQVELAYHAYSQQVFADLAYTEPFYVKEFFNIAQ